MFRLENREFTGGIRKDSPASFTGGVGKGSGASSMRSVGKDSVASSTGGIGKDPVARRPAQTRWRRFQSTVVCSSTVARFVAGQKYANMKYERWNTQTNSIYLLLQQASARPTQRQHTSSCSALLSMHYSTFSEVLRVNLFDPLYITYERQISTSCSFISSCMFYHHGLMH